MNIIEWSLHHSIFKVNEVELILCDHYSGFHHLIEIEDHHDTITITNNKMKNASEHLYSASLR